MSFSYISEELLRNLNRIIIGDKVIKVIDNGDGAKYYGVVDKPR